MAVFNHNKVQVYLKQYISYHYYILNVHVYFFVHMFNGKIEIIYVIIQYLLHLI
jgi:hypothetical protein